MTDVNIESKSKLAKLFASENIIVEHVKARTASFDVVNRVLRLPIWKDMSGYLYDLLVGHEAAHALYTPSDKWMKILDEISESGYKHFLNVLEDVRIEKKIKRKFPGLSYSFKLAYDDLIERDFFGILGKDINTFPFIDRINIFFKTNCEMDINFSDDERIIIEKIIDIETWDDVVALTEEIYEYSKKELENLSLEYLNEINEFYSDEFEDDSYDTYESEYNETEETNNDEQDENSDHPNTKTSSNGTEPPEKETPLPRCITEEKFNENKESLLDDQSKEYVYYDIPEVIPEKVITPYKIVHQQITEYYSKQKQDNVNELYSAFKKKNKKYVDLLVKEFEMKKAATLYSKTKISDTGEINVNKLALYKIDDNIFCKSRKTPKGKSHGMVILLDASGSMDRNMVGSLEQLLILVMFSKKVNIPFVVYSFNDVLSVISNDDRLKNNGKLIYDNVYKKLNKNDLILNRFRLREYLNSEMTPVEFIGAFKNICRLIDGYKESYYIRNHLPPSEDLGGTPLSSSLVGLKDIILNFKKKNNIDIVNLSIIHDGDSSGFLCNRDSKYGTFDIIYLRNRNIFFKDKKIKFQEKLTGEGGIPLILKWLKFSTGANIVGFFIMNRVGKYEIAARYVEKSGEKISQNPIKVDEIYKKFKNEKYVESFNKGYDNFFFISGGKDAEFDDFEVDENTTERKMTSLFMKKYKNRSIARNMVTKFIDTISI